MMTTNGSLVEKDYINEYFTNLVMKDEGIYETSYMLDDDGGRLGDVISLVTSDGKNDLS